MRGEGVNFIPEFAIVPVKLWDLDQPNIELKLKIIYYLQA